MYEYLRKGY